MNANWSSKTAPRARAVAVMACLAALGAARAHAADPADRADSAAATNVSAAANLSAAADFAAATNSADAAAASESIRARAQPARFYGLLRARDLSPFGFLRLDMRPAHAVNLAPGDWAFESELGYQNTWALSPRVEQYLSEQAPHGRHALGPADLEALRALPGENYLVDVETASLDLTFHYKLSPHLAAYFIASGVSYQGGFLDGAIEKFHDTFGFSSFGRPAVARNDTNVFYDLKSANVAELGSLPTSGGLLDPTIGLRYGNVRLGESWYLSVEAAAKVAVAGRRTLLSTGRTDWGLQTALQYRGTRQAFYLDLAGVYYAGADFPVPQRKQVIPTLIVGYEYALTPRTNINLQAYASKSELSRRETDLDELRERKYQVTAGFRHRISECLVTFGVTENIQNLNNTPDIGFQLGLAWIPELKADRRR
jgi:hypothetical protein